MAEIGTLLGSITEVGPIDCLMLCVLVFTMNLQHNSNLCEPG